MEKIKTELLAGDFNFYHIGWKSYNLIRKKAMDKESNLAGLLISLSIAFFIVLASAQALHLIHQSLEEKGEGTITNKTIYKLESYNIEKENKFIRSESLGKEKKQILNKIFLIHPVNAAEDEDKGEIEKWTDYLTLKSDETKTYTVKIKNTGGTIWKKESIFLETGPYLRSFSQFKADNWLKYFRPAGLNKDIRPGEVLSLTFSLKASTNKEGVIQQNFWLVKNNAKSISGTTLRLFINVVQPEKVAKNNTSALNSSASVALSPQPDSGKPDFCLAMTAGEAGYENCETNPEEQDLTNGISQAPIMLPAEPIIRIGLYNTKNAQRITANSIYDVYADEEIILSGVRAEEISSVSFDFNTKQYAVSTPNITRFTANHLRFRARDPKAVFALSDFENRTKWNTSLNDNKFRGVMEFHYSDQTGKLWVINELPLENYLKGLAETTNFSPLDFQKVVVTAARTYAMYHYNRGVENNIKDGSTKHASEHFHLDSVYDQVYRGYASEARMPKLSQAIDATRGVVIAYNNKVVITPYFSRSDGRTRNWEEVWYGEPKPWLKSVVVSEDNGQTLWGHGVGMSARGALMMVNKNKKWQEVLKYFYQGVELKRIYK